LGTIAAAADGLPLIVGNPDQVVVRSGGKVVNCPGQLADEYARLPGGREPPCFGKPGPIIFEDARTALRALGAERVCHVGDSLHHDIGGAQRTGVPTLFVRGGVHAKELGEGAPLRELCEKYGIEAPTHEISLFQW